MLLVAGVLADAERDPGGAQHDVTVAAEQQRRGVAGIGPAHAVAVDDGEEDRHEAGRRQALADEAVGLGQHLARALAVERARLDEEADHRAERGDLQALAGDVADEHRQRAAAERPQPEHVAAADLVADRLVDEAELVAGQVVDALGDEAAVSARATRRSRWKSSALAIVAAASRASACRRPSSSRPKWPGSSWLALSTANRRGPIATGTWAKDPIPSASRNAVSKRWASASDEM